MKRTISLVLLILLVIGCGEKRKHAKLTCQICGGTLYDGEFRVHSNGFMEPIGAWSQHEPWDKHCVDNAKDFWKDHAHEVGFNQGYDDWFKGHPHRKFDDTYHHKYTDAYEEGWKKAKEDHTK